MWLVLVFLNLVALIVLLSLLLLLLLLFSLWLFSVVWNFVEKDDFQLSSVVKFKEKKWEMLKNKALQPSTDTDMLSTETTFESLGLDPRLTRALARSNFIKPTLVQATAIPIAFQVFFLFLFLSFLFRHPPRPL